MTLVSGRTLRCPEGRMAASVAAFVEALRRLPVLTRSQFDQLAGLTQQHANLRDLVRELVRRGWLTRFQAEQIGRGRAGELVLDQYVLLDPLGEGGMGAVYKARQGRMNRLVALK